VGLSIRDMRATILGATAQSTSGAVDAANAFNIGDLVINAAQIQATTDDGISAFAADASAIAKAAAINAASADTGVTAVTNSNMYTASASSIQGIALGAGSTLSINNVNIGSVVLQNDDTDGALRAAINNFTNQTGVTASMDANSNLVLTAADGRNISVYTTGSAGGALGFTADTSTNLGTGPTSPATFGSTITLISDEAFNVAGTNASYAGLTPGGVEVDVNTAINQVTVVTQEEANTAIRTVDAALRQVNNFRASLGAVTNRLEATIANLRTVAENLAASESRVRDADFASETALLTRNQILQQAGVAILAQANITPQAALTLLQG
jgi:flagellin